MGLKKENFHIEYLIQRLDILFKRCIWNVSHVEPLVLQILLISKFERVTL